MAVTPYLNFAFACEVGFNHLAANRCRSLLAAPKPCTPWTVYVVETRNSHIQTEVFHVVAAHPLGEEFFPAIAIFGQCRIRV